MNVERTAKILQQRNERLFNQMLAEGSLRPHVTPSAVVAYLSRYAGVSNAHSARC